MKKSGRLEAFELEKRKNRDDMTNEILIPYLTDYLGTNEIHWYNNLSVSQTIEKLDLAYGRSLRFERINAKMNDASGLNLQVVINIGPTCR